MGGAVGAPLTLGGDDEPGPSVWGDVLVAPEQVGRVPAALDLDQPVPGGAGIGLVDPLGALVGEEVDVGAVVALVEGGREVVDPGLTPGPVGGAVVERG